MLKVILQFPSETHIPNSYFSADNMSETEVSQKDDEPKPAESQTTTDSVKPRITLGPPTKRDRRPWTAQEDETLMLAVLEERKRREMDVDESDDEDSDDEEDWDAIAFAVSGRTAIQCLRRYNRHLNRKDEELEEKNQQSKKQPGIESSKARSDVSDGGNVSESKKRPPSTVVGAETLDIPPPASKRAKQEQPGEASTAGWTQDDTFLLQKLVEQYQECKFLP